MSLVSSKKKKFKVQGWFWMEFRVGSEVQGSFHVPGFSTVPGFDVEVLGWRDVQWEFSLEVQLLEFTRWHGSSGFGLKFPPGWV